MFRWLANLKRRLMTDNRAAVLSDRVDEVESEFAYQLPFACGERFQVLQGYGGAYSHTDESHFSLDFRMPERTPICASRSGIVYRVVDRFTDGGTHPSFKPKANTIHILHADDSIASYVHLAHNGSCVWPGQFVRAGQLIGVSGNTGWSDSPHLHFHVCDAITRERHPTLFCTVEQKTSVLTENNWYTKPPNEETSSIADEFISKPMTSHPRDPFAFSAQLLQHQSRLLDLLAEEGFDLSADFSSVDTIQDVHGLEVCGIPDGSVAVSITRLLLREFPGWNAGWLHEPDFASLQKWVASIERDHDLVTEYWDTD